MQQHNSPYPTIQTHSKTQKFSKIKSAPTPTDRKIHIIHLLASSRFPVFLAYSKTEFRYFAVKLFPYSKDQISNSYKNQKRFLELSHPNIITIYEHCDFKEATHSDRNIKSSHVIMELAPYGDFCQFLKQTSIH